MSNVVDRFEYTPLTSSDYAALHIQRKSKMKRALRDVRLAIAQDSSVNNLKEQVSIEENSLDVSPSEEANLLLNKSFHH